MSPGIHTPEAATVLDFGTIESGIREHEAEGYDRSRAFTHYVIETVFGIPRPEVSEHVVDGGADRGIDIIYIDHNHKLINIGTCKTVLAFKKSTRYFPGEEVDKVISFVDDLLFHRDSLIDGCNGALAAKVREIWEIVSSDSYKVAVHLFSNQATLEKGARERLSSALGRHSIALHEHGLYELAKNQVRSTRPQFSKQLRPVLEPSLSVDPDGRRGLVLRATLRDLAEFLTDGELFDERLVWQNVRYFLGLDNEVNREIRETLVSGRSADFWYLNSGLTIVCDRIVSLANGHHPLAMINPQIVNGCQTAAVIYSVAANTLHGVGDGYVNLKIIETTDETFIEQVALASNTQSRILNRDLRANDPLQHELAICLRREGYFYRRKRGEVSPNEESMTIDAGRVGQLMLAYVEGDPTRSKTDTSEIFGELYDIAFEPNLVTSQVVIAAHRCFSEIERRRSQALAWQASVSRNSYEESWIIEGRFHLLFVVGELLKRENRNLSEVDRALELLDEASEIMREFVRARPKISAYRLFRLSQSRDELLKIIGARTALNPAYPIQLDLFKKATATTDENFRGLPQEAWANGAAG